MSDTPFPILDSAAKSELLKIARGTLERYLSGGSIGSYQPNSSHLQVDCGAFVTLRQGGALRGCIGQLARSDPLYLTVQQCVINSATKDSRFAPVRPEEVADLTIEISVLSTLRPLRRMEDIRLGLHGLVVSARGHKGLLLPQVATEHAWDSHTFLRQTCKKAGLHEHAWEDESTLIEYFSCQVFAEGDVN